MQGIAPAQRSKRSAGIVLYRRRLGAIEILLVHPGGPYWEHRDDAAWSIPKGEYEVDEEPLAAARREFEEETGIPATGNFIELGELRQPGGKVVSAWAFEGDCDPKDLRSNTFTLEWPPKSGRQMEFPEVDRGSWYSVEEARRRLTPGQIIFVDRLLQKVGIPIPPSNR